MGGVSERSVPGAARRIFVAAILGVALVAGGCGGDDPVDVTHRQLSFSSDGGTTMQLTSTAFSEGSPIPARYTCDGDDVSPPLEIDGAPDATQTLVLVMDDPDAPGDVWDHWVAFDIAPRTEIPENVGPLGVGGANSWGRTGYGGPCPPSGTHRYFFTVYAVDSQLALGPGASKADLMESLEGHVLDQATLMGTYAR
jgi:Raf kinase inhibitor-like YbhB/YbcL family protein